MHIKNIYSLVIGRVSDSSQLSKGVSKILCVIQRGGVTFVRAKILHPQAPSICFFEYYLITHMSIFS
jgi:hypothetical protein